MQAKINHTYKYGYQIAPYIVLFQSTKNERQFLKVSNLVDLGYIRRRRDGISEYIIGRSEDIRKFVDIVKPFVILKKKQLDLIIKILNLKHKVKNQKDFENLLKLIDKFRDINYSKKLLVRTLTP